MALDYPYLRAWDRMMGSYAYWTEEQVKIARAEKAPARAIFKSHEGDWVTIDQVKSAISRQWIENYVKRHFNAGVVAR